MPLASDLAPGAPLGEYIIRHRIGAGGMGVVYEAWDPRLQRAVALKLLIPAEAPGRDPARTLLQEARAAAALNHPNVCTVYEVGAVDGTPFIAMELVEGETLRDLLARGPLTPSRIIRFGRDLSSALAAAHERGVIHRDLKSANVMVTADDRLKVLDFGIAQRQSRSTDETRTGTAPLPAGTLAYMAPELIQGRDPTPQSDLWALGIVLYEMVTGRLPFGGGTHAETSAAILRDPLPALPAGTPPGMAHVIERCLEREAVHRPRTAGEIALAFETMQAAGPAEVAVARRFGTRLVLAGAAAVVVGALAASAVMWRPGSVTAATGPVDAIAVLPFANLSGSADQEFFADGITEAIITDLGKISTMRVIARASVMQYRSRPKPPADVARELDVDVLVDGSVVHAGDRVRISAQIVAPADGRVLWSDNFERDTREILALHSDIARAVALQVRATLSPGAADRVTAPATQPKAHELLLLGRYHAYRKNPESGRKAIDYLREALQIDPDYAPAYASLADAYRLLEIWGGAGVGAYADESRAAASRAIALDPGLPEAHMVMGILLSQRDWQWEAADREFRRAIELAPSYSDAHAEYAFFLQGLGQYEAGVQSVRRAVDLDPLSADHWSQLGRVLFRARRHDEAIRAFERSLELDPNFGSAISRLIDVYLVLGRLDKAEALLEKRGDLLGGAIGQTAQLYALSGRGDQARALLALRGPRNQAGGLAAVFAYIALGDHDRALDYLEDVVRRRQVQGFAIRDPRLDPIVNSPRFVRILEAMNLAR